MKRSRVGRWVSAASLLAALLVPGLVPQHAAAATFEVSGWLPYWRAATSTADVLPHLNKLTEINPFGFTVKNDGTLYDAAGLLAYPVVSVPAAVNQTDSGLATSTPWYPLITAARAQKVRVIPTVMWSDTNAIDTVLSSTTLRAQNVDAIVAMVKQGGFDGVDIDYEGKKASDIDYFSDFLKELYAAMGNNWVDCTIEARTPPQDLNTNTPMAQIQYANDYTAINKYCDRVRLMTYDQESIDKTLNDAAGNRIYTPVSDPQWVTAVVQLAEKSIKPSKLEIGIATYGYEYNITPYANNSGFMYDLLWSFNPGYATQIENLFHVTPIRNGVGELAFTYTPTTTPETLPSGTGSATPTNANQTASIGTAVAQAAGNYGLSGTVRYMTWSDSVAIAQKVALAKKLGVRGGAIFKLDGGEDQNIWNVIP
ncbi:MAG: glycosyl hydrolase family 18 protein [Candidatus Pacebacteria bacterium]|nr:glycosyl hydrolase family 18 protein [Candidatus Paceibacterota bacterium]